MVSLFFFNTGPPVFHLWRQNNVFCCWVNIAAESKQGREVKAAVQWEHVTRVKGLFAYSKLIHSRILPKPSQSQPICCDAHFGQHVWKILSKPKGRHGLQSHLMRGRFQRKEKQRQGIFFVYSVEVLNFPSTFLAHFINTFNTFQGCELLDLMRAWIKPEGNKSPWKVSTGSED